MTYNSIIYIYIYKSGTFLDFVTRDPVYPF